MNDKELRILVFAASTFEGNKTAIEHVKKAIHSCEYTWMLENDVAMNAYHSTFNVNDDGYKMEVYLKNSYLYHLINDCKDFSRELYKLKQEDNA